MTGSYACTHVTPITVWVASKNESNCLLENKMMSIWRRVRYCSLLINHFICHRFNSAISDPLSSQKSSYLCCHAWYAPLTYKRRCESMNSAILSICQSGIVEMANHYVQLPADGNLKSLRQSPLHNLRRPAQRRPP